MVRALFDYSIFIHPLLSNKNKRSLQNIQDIKSYLPKKYDFDMVTLHLTAEFETLDIRSKKLLCNYFISAEEKSNPLVEDLLIEFERFQINFKNENILKLLDFI